MEGLTSLIISLTALVTAIAGLIVAFAKAKKEQKHYFGTNKSTSD